jgi:hypothetical protein
LFEKLNFSFINDLAPVAGVVRFPNVMTEKWRSVVRVANIKAEQTANP